MTPSPPLPSRPFAVLASYLAGQRDSILNAWREAVARDPQLATVSMASRAEFDDHIPHVLQAFERQLRASDPDAHAEALASEAEGASEHGLQRWRQGYDQRQTIREWAHLHECLLDALERFGAREPALAARVFPQAHRFLARLCSIGICESASRYNSLLRAEAATQVREIEHALAEVRALERQRAEAWREAAHDLRGSVSVIAGAAAVLNRDNVSDPARTQFSQVLRKGVLSLHEMLTDLMSLARLEAGQDRRTVAPFDAAALLKESCEAMRPLAAERGLFLRCEGPETLAVQGDAAKVRRIAQNLLLNAFNATDSGGVMVQWASDAQQWTLTIHDTGHGFEAMPPLARALEQATQDAQKLSHTDAGAANDGTALPTSEAATSRADDRPGEGIGLSIVKRLCELLDASVELESAAGRGTTFRITLPRSYVT